MSIPAPWVDHPLRVPVRRFLGGIAFALLAIASCSDDPLTQPAARDRAAGAVCDYQSRCGNIGAPPATFTSRDDCLITWKDTVQNLWPPDQCTKIIDTGLDLCIAAIRNEACADAASFLTTLTSCSKANVCGTP